MPNQKGFSLIEVLVAVSLIGIAAAVVTRFVSGSGNGSLSMGINGVTESRCIDGFKFIVGAHGNSRQVLNENGGGIRCE